MVQNGRQRPIKSNKLALLQIINKNSLFEYKIHKCLDKRNEIHMTLTENKETISKTKTRTRC